MHSFVCPLRVGILIDDFRDVQTCFTVFSRRYSHHFTINTGGWEKAIKKWPTEGIKVDFFFQIWDNRGT